MHIVKILILCKAWSVLSTNTPVKDFQFANKAIDTFAQDVIKLVSNNKDSMDDLLTKHMDVLESDFDEILENDSSLKQKLKKLKRSFEGEVENIVDGIIENSLNTVDRLKYTIANLKGDIAYNFSMASHPIFRNLISSDLMLAIQGSNRHTHGILWKGPKMQWTQLGVLIQGLSE